MVREKSEAALKIETACAELGLTLTSEFVPFSQSRYAKIAPAMDDLRLNWKITLRHNGRDVITTDYSAGIGYCPSYERYQLGRTTVYKSEVIRKECETGKKVLASGTVSSVPIEPEFAGVIACLIMDAEAIDYATFEDWADNTGDDPDSRKAEACYRSCLEAGLKIRAALGDDGLAKLREACAGY